MKRLSKIIVISFIILSSALGLSSCGYVELGVGFDLEGTSGQVRNLDYLCSTVWQDTWTGPDGISYHQELRFYPDFTAQEYFVKSDYAGIISESSTLIYWAWNGDGSSIRLDYGHGDISYMDNIYGSNGVLHCIFDGERTTFYSKY